MSSVLTVSLRATLIAVGLMTCSAMSLAAGDVMDMPTTTSASTVEVQQEQSWHREQSVKPDTRAIIQQKAQIRAQQRMDRLASMNWYGMSNSRPQGSPTPFFTRYSPTWEMPGGKPYSWYPQSRPGYVMYWR